jgi:hypothetical protein
MDPFTLDPRPRPGRCRVKGCRHHVTPGQRRKQGGFCRRCKEDRYKVRHPYTYALNKLRNNARRRGHAFDLTLEEWIMFCDLTGYVDARGRGAEDLSIDRIRDSEGYTLSNIRVLTVSENSRRAAVRRKIESWDRAHWARIVDSLVSNAA